MELKISEISHNKTINNFKNIKDLRQIIIIYVLTFLNIIILRILNHIQLYTN